MDDERGVSPVIGVILMVAITVILAAVIGTMVLGMTDNVGTNAQAGVSFDQSGSGSGVSVDIQVTSMGNAESLDVSFNPSGVGSSSTGDLSGVGSIKTINDLSTGNKITVTATVDGSSNVIATYTVK